MALRVTFLLPHAGLTGGVRVVAQYADYLRRRGHGVTVISQPWAGPSVRERIKGVLRGEWVRGRREHGPSHLDGLGLDWRVLERARPVVDGDVPDGDVVVATWWETAEWVWRLAPSKGRKVYFCQHDEVHVGLPRERVDATYGLPMTQICVSQWVAEEIRRRHPVARQVVVPNGVDAARFSVPPRGRQAEVTVGFISGGPRWKGSDIAMEAIRLARRAVPGLRVVSFGHEPSVGMEGIEFHRTPAQERIPSLYGSCDVWLFSSRVEGFGLPILEAMACRTPVVATPAGAAPELMAGGGGILVGHEDPAGMAEALVKVCRLPEGEWRAMSDRARATAEATDVAVAAGRFERELGVLAWENDSEAQENDGIGG